MQRIDCLKRKKNSQIILHINGAFRNVEIFRVEFGASEGGAFRVPPFLEHLVHFLFICNQFLVYMSIEKYFY